MWRLTVLLAALVPFVLLAAQPASAVNKCVLWVWIDGWRCALYV